MHWFSHILSFENIPKYSDFSTDDYLKGDKISIKDILNKEIIITGIKAEHSKLKAGEIYNKIQIVDKIENDEPHYAVFFTSSTVLAREIQKYKNKLPFRATIIQENKYFTLV